MREARLSTPASPADAARWRQVCRSGLANHRHSKLMSTAFALLCSFKLLTAAWRCIAHSEVKQGLPAVCTSHVLGSSVERADGVCRQQRGGSCGVAGQRRHPPRLLWHRGREDCATVVVGGVCCWQTGRSACCSLSRRKLIKCASRSRTRAPLRLIARVEVQEGETQLFLEGSRPTREVAVMNVLISNDEGKILYEAEQVGKPVPCLGGRGAWAGLGHGAFSSAAQLPPSAGASQWQPARPRPAPEREDDCGGAVAGGSGAGGAGGAGAGAARRPAGAPPSTAGPLRSAQAPCKARSLQRGAPCPALKRAQPRPAGGGG
jgi:hypothetical protein